MYELWGTGTYTQRQQEILREELRTSWGAGADAEKAAIGDGLAVIRIPRLGQDYEYVIVEGVGVEDLKKGPGHYPGTAMPGQVGNFVLSGHRTTYSAPFNRIDELRPGDPIVVETRNFWYVYRVTEKTIVLPTEIEVIEPVPGRPGVKPTNRLITLTTCYPEYSATKRLIVFGELAAARKRSAGGGQVDAPTVGRAAAG